MTEIKNYHFQADDIDEAYLQVSYERLYFKNTLMLFD